VKCPYCSSTETRVVNSRPSDEGHAIRRRRECDACHRRFTTYERTQLEALMVRKRSGRLEAFQPDKLLGKLRVATNKRPVTEKQLREFAYGFEDEVQTARIDTDEIGRRTLAFLKSLDDVAYIRFLSVYRDFDSVDRFVEEIRQLGGRVAAPAHDAERATASTSREAAPGQAHESDDDDADDRSEAATGGLSGEPEERSSDS